MQYGFVIDGGDANAISELTREAEVAGWDGVFIADAVDIGMPNHPPFPWFDPWIVLTAMALCTERIRIGTPEGERFAWVVATNVYLKSSQGWRLVAHHASPGTAGEAQESPEETSTLH